MVPAIIVLPVKEVRARRYIGRAVLCRYLAYSFGLAVLYRWCLRGLPVRWSLLAWELRSGM